LTYVSFFISSSSSYFRNNSSSFFKFYIISLYSLFYFVKVRWDWINFSLFC